MHTFYVCVCVCVCVYLLTYGVFPSSTPHIMGQSDTHAGITWGCFDPSYLNKVLTLHQNLTIDP